MHANEMIDVHRHRYVCAEGRLKGFKAFQSSRICLGYSYKQNVAFVLTGFSLPHRYHFDGRSNSESKEPRFRLLKVEANAVICIHPKFFKQTWLLAQEAQAGHVHVRVRN